MAKEKSEKVIVGKVTLLNVRLSFASLFEMNRKKQDDGTVRETWKANFLISKEDAKNMIGVFQGKKMPLLAAIKAASAEAKEAKWGAEKNWPKLKADRIFLRDGDEEDWEGYPGNWYVSANAQPQDRPSVVTNRKDGDNRWIPAEPGGKNAPYSGCYVNATIVVWAQDNEHGKRLNAQVRAVQFYRDGEAFGAGSVDPNDEFDDEMVGEEGDFSEDDGTDDMV